MSENHNAPNHSTPALSTEGKREKKRLGNLCFSPVAEKLQVMNHQLRGWADPCRFRVEGTSKII